MGSEMCIRDRATYYYNGDSPQHQQGVGPPSTAGNPYTVVQIKRARLENASRTTHPETHAPACCTKSIKNVQSSQQSSDRSCFCTNTRTTRTRQNKPYRLGVLPAGVVGARGRCCPAATVPVAVVFACGVCCCCLLYTSPSPRDLSTSRMPSSA